MAIVMWPHKTTRLSESWSDDGATTSDVYEDFNEIGRAETNEKVPAAF